MTIRYVGIGGSNSNNGLTWATRKLTLGGVESTVAAGDTVYVGPGKYREVFSTVIAGSSGSPITYIADYDGSHTDGVGGVVRITNSNNEITSNSDRLMYERHSYRSFKGFLFQAVNSNLYQVDMSNSHEANITNVIFENCAFVGERSGVVGYVARDLTFRNCYFCCWSRNITINMGNSTYIDDSNILIENCIFEGARDVGSITIYKTGGITIRNCTFHSVRSACVNVAAVPNSGQTVAVNNCIFEFVQNALLASNTAGILLEDYNTFHCVFDPRGTNVATGAHSVTYPPQYDMRWFFEMVNGGRILTRFDLASYSALINVAGTSPTTADMRGTTVQGTQREWGTLEYDSTLDIKAGAGGTSSVKIMPLGRVGL